MSVTAMPKNEAEEQAKRRPVRLIAFVAVLAIAAGAGWFLVLAPQEPKDTGPQPGAVAHLESLQINLAAGHYLRLGVALQLTEEAGAGGGHGGGGEFDGSQALDAAISIFSGLPLEEVNTEPKRELLREQLLLALKERYHGDVMGVYFTEFVTQ
ncbi:MAG TPA: flagellar basal body-associated FliL family protein [Nocardioides sp.]|uniref:flagellar basal body-associated FliL family protein n=1 Tax=Nocardioides sp. TaxID=35761 RepID=UPI002EDB55F2